MVQLVGVSSYNQRVVDSVPGQGTSLGCGSDPWSRRIWESANQCFSFSESSEKKKAVEEDKNFFLKN